MPLIHPAKLAACLVTLLAPLAVQAATYHVAPTGNDNNAGTDPAAPWLTVTRAQRTVRPGDTVLIHGGTFAISTGTVGASFTTSGTAALPINYFAAPGEARPVFDLTGQTPNARVTGLDVNCSWVHIRGVDVMGVHQFQSGQDSWGVRIQGSNNVIEDVVSHNNDAPGFFITSGANNLILNCDSHNNYDFLEGGGSGDGFGCHSSGGGNVLSGCRSYDNSDDGFDFINAAGTCTVEKSFSFRNGFVPGTTTAAGNGAGFKAGGYGSPPVVPAGGAAMHTVRQCVAFGNRAEGFYANHHPGRINFYNNTAFRNPANYNMLADAGFPSSHVLRNNIAMASGSTISNLTGGTDTFNSWTLSVTVSAADFLSVAEAEAQTARAADGSLPTINFMHLVAGSDLIDKGTDVQLPFAGAAPDLGAFEFGAVVTGAGGSTVTGSGGNTGTTGAGGSTVTGTGGRGAGGSTGAGGSVVVTGSGGNAGNTGTTGAGGSVVVTGGGGNTGTTGAGGRSVATGTGGRTGGGAADAGGEVGTASGGCACGTAAGRGGVASSVFLSLSILALLALRGRRRSARGQARGASPR
jgi:hypothetical protein